VNAAKAREAKEVRDPGMTFWAGFLYMCQYRQSYQPSAREIQIRYIGNFTKADPAYGEGVAKALGIPLSELSK